MNSIQVYRLHPAQCSCLRQYSRNTVTADNARAAPPVISGWAMTTGPGANVRPKCVNQTKESSTPTILRLIT